MPEVAISAAAEDASHWRRSSIAGNRLLVLRHTDFCLRSRHGCCCTYGSNRLWPNRLWPNRLWPNRLTHTETNHLMTGGADQCLRITLLSHKRCRVARKDIHAITSRSATSMTVECEKRSHCFGAILAQAILAQVAQNTIAHACVEVFFCVQVIL